jgi:methionyl aminopeptidase
MAGMKEDITIKTPEAIAALRHGGKLHAAILDELEKEVRAGATTLDVDDRAMELLEEYGLEPMTLGYKPHFAPRPYPAATCVSINDVVVHGIPNEDPVTFVAGDVVSIDLVTAYEGVVLDAARTVGVGALAPQDRQLIDVTRAALKAGIAAATPGARVSDIGKAVESAVPEGFAIIQDFCGHGVGYELHEPPQIPNFYIKGASPVLEPGMVLAIEPMIIVGDDPGVVVDRDGYTALTTSGHNSAHMEHTVLVTEKGPEVLTIR